MLRKRDRRFKVSSTISTPSVDGVLIGAIEQAVAPDASIAWFSNNFRATVLEWFSLGAGEQQRYTARLKLIMSLPDEIDELFRRGIALAAQVSTRRSGWFAWIFIEPKMRSGLTYNEQLDEWTRTREARNRYDDTIAYFMVRYTELSDWHLQPEWADDLDVAIWKRPVADWIVEIPDKHELEKFLETRLPNLNELRSPSAVDYPFPPTNWTERIDLSEIEGAV